MDLNSDEKSFKYNNPLVLHNNYSNSVNNISNKIDEEVDESESITSSEETISKFDKYVYTFILCYANLTYGISLTCMSPALIDFTCILEAEKEIVAHYYTLYAIGTIIGSLFGFLFKYINRQVVLILALLLFGVAIGVLPIAPNFLIFYLFGFIGGVGAGTLDIVQTVWLIEMWEHSSGSILQLSEFTYGLGIIFGSLIVDPFLREEEACSNITIEENFLEYEKASAKMSRQLVPPFLVSGSALAIGAIILGIMYFYSKYVPTSTIEEKEMIEKEIEEVLKPIEKIYQRRYTVQIMDNKPTKSPSGSLRMDPLQRKHNPLPRFSIQINAGGRTSRKSSEANPRGSLAMPYKFPIKRRYSSFHITNQEQLFPQPEILPRKTIIGLGAVCFATIIVAETSFIDFAPTFFRFYCNQTSSDSAILLSAMTGAYTLTRAVSILIAIRVRPEHILSVHYVIVFLSIILLWFGPDSTIALWLGNILFGIGIATFWSATFSYIENYFEISDRIGTIYISAMGLLEIVTQFIEGPFLEEKPEVLLFYIISLACVSLACFITIRIIVFIYKIEDKNTSSHNNNTNHTQNGLEFNSQNVAKL